MAGPWVVTRQHQYPDGELVVEISGGGKDYTNPGALSSNYPGEFEEIDDPREAIETAIDIALSWQAESPKDEILIAVGNTLGFTMPFDGEELSEEVFTQLHEWA